MGRAAGTRAAWCASTTRTPAEAILAAARAAREPEPGPDLSARLRAAGWLAQVEGHDGQEITERWWLAAHPPGGEAFFYTRLDLDNVPFGRGWAFVIGQEKHGLAYQVCASATTPAAVTAALAMIGAAR
jgi:hypothetical protein